MKLYPAPIARRFWSFVIDYMILMFGFSFIIGSLSIALSMAPEWVQIGVIGFLGILMFFYLPLMETFCHGQTLGKMLMATRVVREDGSPASGVECFQRFLMMPFDVFTIVGGLLSASISKRNQRFGDIVAGTIVVMTKPQPVSTPELRNMFDYEFTEEERGICINIDNPERIKRDNDPLSLAKRHRDIECSIARLRTIKGNPRLIEHMESQLSKAHIDLFRHKSYSFADMVSFTLRSIPRAVYQARWCIFASLFIAFVSWSIGVYSQTVNDDFFRDLFGDRYYEITVENMNNGDPMGIYSSQDQMPMFVSIFFNNLMVTLRLYVMGLFTFIGPLFMLVMNFVSFGAFDAFFAQHGFWADALITPNEHGVLELSSVIIAGGASLRLGTGWLFPGKLSRLKAFKRTARESLLILLSTIPMLLVAAFIEGFITRYTSLPMAIKLAIIIVSFFVILGYYVMLPLISKDR